MLSACMYPKRLLSPFTSISPVQTKARLVVVKNGFLVLRYLDGNLTKCTTTLHATVGVSCADFENALNVVK